MKIKTYNKVIKSLAQPLTRRAYTKTIAELGLLPIVEKHDKSKKMESKVYVIQEISGTRYGAPKIKTEPTVTAGIPGLASTFNVSLSGENFGERGEVLRFDGWCNATLNQQCGEGVIRKCIGGNILDEDDRSDSYQYCYKSMLDRIDDIVSKY